LRGAASRQFAESGPKNYRSNGAELFMRRTTIHLVELIILGICFLSLGMMKAEACDCDKPRLGKTALEEADAVFSGRITEVKFLDDPKKVDKEWRIVVTFAVLRVWKEVAAKEFVLHTIYNRASCDGYAFEQGKVYLVFARKNGEADRMHFESIVLPQKSYGVRLCGGTSLLGEAKEYLAELGEGRPPQ